MAAALRQNRCRRAKALAVILVEFKNYCWDNPSILKI
jgi:hypothetical protein